MEPFTSFKAIAVPIDIPNCDTDQIIPVRFVRMAQDDPDYPKFFLHDLRFNEDGSEKDFIFNTPPFNEAKILVTDVNWGCGSSRENAVYTMAANGIRSVIAPSIADIHYNNCKKNGVVPVVLDEAVCNEMRQQLHAAPGTEISVDLESQSVIGPDGATHSFDIDPFDKHRLLKGLDDISLTLEYEEDIKIFEARHEDVSRWMYP
ncbi:MAG: 3-isopropylmalate dehydratase small subunit [Rhodospirillaceae bacterium]|nr:3-isopropylmalate dehydratase small subunit [Rhodospirillaceae bacterium]|tara:strand:+ start:1509 stop:2120 length:612 start_codon:yes stop_codon:yes gene_type:complete